MLGILVYNKFNSLKLINNNGKIMANGLFSNLDSFNGLNFSLAEKCLESFNVEHLPSFIQKMTLYTIEPDLAKYLNINKFITKQKFIDIITSELIRIEAVKYDNKNNNPIVDLTIDSELTKIIMKIINDNSKYEKGLQNFNFKYLPDYVEYMLS